MNKNILISAMAIVILVLGLTVLMLRLDRNGPHSFTTLRDARASGLAEKGWIPDSFPDCLEDVQITMDIDTNEAFYEFTLPPNCR